MKTYEKPRIVKRGNIRHCTAVIDMKAVTSGVVPPL